MMRVLLDGLRVRSIWEAGTVAVQADDTRRSNQLGVVRGAMHVVTTETGDASRIHEAGDEIVSLHPVFMARTVRKMRERRRPKSVFLELPEILEVEPRAKTHRPIVVPAVDGVDQRFSLRV